MSACRPYTDTEIQLIAKKWNAGKPLAIIACDHDRSIGSIRLLASRNRGVFYRRRSGPHRGINYETAAKMRAEGFTLQAIADRYSVTPAAIHYALRRLAEQHVSGGAA